MTRSRVDLRPLAAAALGVAVGVGTARLGWSMPALLGVGGLLLAGLVGLSKVTTA